MSHWEPMTALTPLVPGEPPVRPGPAGPGPLEPAPQIPGPAASYPAGPGRPTQLAAASPADLVLRHGARSGTADPRRVHPRSRWATGRLARMGARRDHRGVLAARGAGPVGPSGRDGRLRAGRPARHHLHAGGLREVAGVPAARSHRDPGGRYRAVPRADPGPGRRPAAGDQRARRAGHPGRRGGRRHAHAGPGLGPLPRQLPADHPGHAAPDAASPARAVERVLPPAPLHHRGRVPHLPGSVRLPRRPGAAQAAQDRRASRRPRSGQPGTGRPGPPLPARLRHGQRACRVRVPADRAAG